MIVDLSRCEGCDRDYMNLNAMRTISSNHPKTRWIVVIDPKPHPVARFIGVSVIKLLGLHYHVTESDDLSVAPYIVRGLTFVGRPSLDKEISEDSESCDL